MKKLLCIFTLAFALTGCEKDGNSNKSDEFVGTYTGNLRVVTPNNVIQYETEIILGKNGFKVEKGFKSEGTFKVDGMFHFTDPNAGRQTFDVEYLLNGTYGYEIKGDSLILTKDAHSREIKTSYLQYRLKRVGQFVQH